MNAIRVRKRGRGMSEHYKAHWLLDPGRTYCGLHVDDLAVVEQLELEKLPALEECRMCTRVVGDWIVNPHNAERVDRVVSNPQPGRLRTTGPLHHGFGRRSGRRLG